MHEDSMKKLQGGCVSWLVLLTRAAQLLLVCGEGSPAVQCPELPPIPNGSIEYDIAPFYLGTMATYMCNDDFYLNGDDERNCTTEEATTIIGTWTGQEPQCVCIICQPLFPYPYGMITYHHETSPYSYGTRARYNISCPPKLERSGGDDERNCSANGNSGVGVWSGAAPICAARGVFLSFQGITYTTNNSNIVLTRIDTTNDTSLTCHTDSTTCCRGVDNGDPSSSMGSGEWNGTSIVRRKRVPRPDDGFYYTRFHQAVKLYRNDDTQTPLGTCCRIPDSGGVLRTFCANLIDITIRCPSDSVMAPTNGMVSYSSPVEGGSYVYGTVATFSCSPGFGLSTLETRTCTGTNDAEIGTFSDLNPTCDGITCPAPPNVVNGMIVYSPLGTTEVFNYGTAATYQCNPGYNITSGDRVRTCTGNDSTPSGQWDGTAPQCPPVDCGTPLSITNGSPGIPTTTTFTGTVTYSCNDGYALFGIATSTCQADATWSRLPECRERICPVGTYHEELSTGESVCVPCPRNTFSIVENSVECTCFRGYYRTKLEEPNFPCSSPPVSCKSLQVVAERTRGNTITVHWERPEITGRDDFYYNIFYSEDNQTFTQHNSRPYVKQDALVDYSVSGLRPLTTYTIRVIPENGVSDQEDGGQNRSCDVVTMTGDTRSNAPSLVIGFCTVVVWIEPTRSYGRITGYDVRFIPQGSGSDLVVSKGRKELFHAVGNDTTLISTDNAMVQVRAKTSVTEGRWSEVVPLGCKNTEGSTGPI